MTKRKFSKCSNHEQEEEIYNKRDTTHLLITAKSRLRHHSTTSFSLSEFNKFTAIRWRLLKVILGNVEKSIRETEAHKSGFRKVDTLET